MWTRTVYGKRGGNRVHLRGSLRCRIILLSVLALTLEGVEARVYPTKEGLLPVPTPREVLRPTWATTTELLFEDFEGGQGAWTITGGVWEIGVPSVGPSGAYSGTQCAGTALDGPYPGNADARLVSPAIPLPQHPSGAGSVRLSFWHWYELENTFDCGTVEVSTDGGTSWIPLGSEYTGTTQSAWRPGTAPLDQYAGNTVHIAFRLTTDGFVHQDGWFVDDVCVKYQEPEPLSVTIASISPSLFPLVYIAAGVDTSGSPANDIPASSFQVFEDGVLQTDAFEVTAPDTSAGRRIIDIVFCVDNSGSMAGKMATVGANVTEFVQRLRASDADFALGLIRFGAEDNGGLPILEDNGRLSGSVPYFLDDLWGRNRASGRGTPGWDALVMAARQITYRPGATRAVVLITDETPAADGSFGICSKEQAISALAGNSIRLFALVQRHNPHAYHDYGTIAEQTGALYRDILTPMDEIVDAVFSIPGNTYIVRYRSSNTTPTGLREVIVRVDYQSSSAEDTACYRPMAAPVITLTPQTQAMIDADNVPADSPVDIEAYIIDHAEPFIQSASLFYRATGTTVFTSVPMVHVSDSLYRAGIPSSSIVPPGIDLYLSATDSVSISYLPAMLPLRDLPQIAVWPNEKPFITHVPPRRAEIGSDLAIRACIQDQTNAVRSARVSYRAAGSVSYESSALSSVGGTEFVGTIPGSSILEDGVEYFLYAEDDFGVRRYDGSPEAPHAVPALACLFNVNRDGYSFESTADNMWPHECWASPVDSAFPTWAVFRAAFSASKVELGGQPTQWASAYWNRIAGPYGGSGFGFATSSLLFYGAHLSLDGLSWTDADSVYGICQGVTPIGAAGAEGDSVRLLINTYQLHQYGDQFKDYMAGIDGITPSATVDTIRAGLGRKALVLFSVVRHYVPDDGMTEAQWLGGGHAVVPYRIESGNDTSFVYVYDPSAPSDTTRFVEVYHSTDQWEYPGLQYAWRGQDGVVHTYGNWAGTSGLCPSPEASVFHETPRLPWSGATGGPFRPTYPAAGSRSHVEVMSDCSVEVLVTDESDRSIGLADSALVDEVPGAFPMVHFEPNPARAAPYGYYLPPTSVYRVAATSRRDTLYNMAVFGMQAAFLIEGSALPAGQSDIVSFDPSGTKVALQTTASSKPYSICMMHPFADHERLFSIEEHGVSSGDSIVYDFVDQGRLSIVSKGALRSYDLRILRAGAAPDSFAASGITIAANTTHTVVVQDWAQPRQRIWIEIDVGSDGTPDDTLHLSQTPATSGSLTGDSIYAYPNPFNPDQEQAMIRFSLEEPTGVSLTITDALGTKVIDLLKGEPMQANVEQSIAWNGRDRGGRIVANGVYFYIIETGTGKRAIGKLAVLR